MSGLRCGVVLGDVGEVLEDVIPLRMSGLRCGACTLFGALARTAVIPLRMSGLRCGRNYVPGGGVWVAESSRSE